MKSRKGKKVPARRNPEARALRSGLFAGKIVPLRNRYSRKRKHKVSPEGED